MTELICKGGESQGDLEAFRLLKPVAGNFKTLTATKQENGIGTDTRMEFENLTISFSNFNIGYDGMGPGCLIQMLVELGMDREAVTKLVEKSKVEIRVSGQSVPTMM